MTIVFDCNDPKSILKSFKDKIALGNKTGGIASWEVDKDGDFIHLAEQIKNKAYLTYAINDSTRPFSITFNAKFYEKATPDERRFAYKEITGNILATFIEHFSGKFQSATFTDTRGN